MNMSNRKKQKRATAKQNVWVEEVEKVWGTLISLEAKEWIALHLEAKLLKVHNGRLTQNAAVEMAKRHKKVERYVKSNALQMQASDMAWAWVAHKAHRGQAVGKVFRPELGPLDDEQVLWQLVAMATTGWRVESCQGEYHQAEGGVFQAGAAKHLQGNGQGHGDAEWGDGGGGAGHGTGASHDDTEAGCDGVVECEQAEGAARQRSGEGEVQGMLAHAHVGGPHRGECGEAPSRQGMGWDGGGDEEAEPWHSGKGETYVFNPWDQLTGSLGDSPDDSEEEVEDGGRDNAAGPGTGAEAGAGQLMMLGGLEEEAGGKDAAGQGGVDEGRGDSTEEEELPSSKGKEKAIRAWLELSTGEAGSEVAGGAEGGSSSGAEAEQSAGGSGHRGEGSQGRGQCGVPGLAGGGTDSQRGDGGAPPSVRVGEGRHKSRWRRRCTSWRQRCMVAEEGRRTSRGRGTWRRESSGGGEGQQGRRRRQRCSTRVGCKATEDGGRRRQGCQWARGREAQGHQSREGCRAKVRQTV